MPVKSSPRSRVKPKAQPAGPFPNAYGHFSADGREYVITRPDTPRPWSNIICAGDYGVALTQAGSGYSWRTHATHNRLTRWEQDLVRDEWGRYLYCRDAASGALWSLSHQPVKAETRDFRCRHGVGYSVFEGESEDIASEWMMFVPPGSACEVWRVRLTNRSRRERTLDLVTYLEWNCGPSPDTHREFHKLFLETEVVPTANAMLATKRLNTIAEHGVGTPWNVEWPHVGVLASSARLKSWESDKGRFLGRMGTLADPAALRAPRGQGVRLAKGEGKWQDAIGAVHVRLTLQPGASGEVAFTLGLAHSRAEALRIARAIRTPAAVERLRRATDRHWAKLLAPLEVKTPDPAFDLLTNTWFKYQAISSRLWGRTGYFQMGGAYGYRDQLQDSQVFLPLAPEHTAAQIRLHARHQFADGTAWHWWHPLTEEGLAKPLNDDLLWLPFVTLNHLRETGDLSLLEAREPFLAPGGKRHLGSGTVYEHCRRAIESFAGRMSKRGVPRMGAGDWNDGLSAIGAKGRSESVWLAHFLIGILEQWAELEARRERPDRVVIRRYTAWAARIRRDVNRHFWDGDWYQRATRDDGSVIGSKKNRDGRIFLNAQTWAVLHDVAPPARRAKLLAALEEHLYADYGPLVLAPAYREPDASIGYLTRYAPGSRENGGLYTHAGVWAIQMECKLGRAEQAWALWKSFCPVLRGADPDFYTVEPYVSPGNVDGPDSPHYGRGGWTWYTGSAAWLFRIQTEWILGVRPEWEGLRVRPCIPSHWNGFETTRRFRGATYRIRASVGSAEPGVWLDGRRLPGDLVPAMPEGGRHEVEVRLQKGPRRGR